jgi:hypothetical protein
MSRLMIAGMLLILCQTTFAQSVAMRVPVLVLKDADGKVVAQVVGFSDAHLPWVVLEIDGVPALFEARPIKGILNSPQIYFSEPGCTGDVYFWRPGAGGSAYLGDVTKTAVVVVGPDAGTGTYRVYHSTSMTEVDAYPLSEWIGPQARCVPRAGDAMALVPGEEVLPNPMAGFHGPTAAEPDRIWTLEGGDKLP